MGRAAKKQRVEASPLLPGITAWLKDAGVWWNADAITIKEDISDAGSSLSIWANEALAAGHHLCTIPKAACLSVRSTSCSDMLEKEQLFSGLGLVIAVMHERALGPNSRWHGYFQSLPDREQLPLFWSKADAKLLHGTELGSELDDEKANVRSDYDDAVAPLLPKYNLSGPGYSFEAFQAAASLVSSRAFKVDEHVGDAMVPLADIFNHKASVVALSGKYAIYEDDDDSSDEEGSDVESEEEGSDAESDEEEEGSDAESGEEGSDAESDEEGSGDEDSNKLESSDAKAPESGDDSTAVNTEAAHPHSHDHDDDGLHHCCDGGKAAKEEDLSAILAAETPELHGMQIANGLGLALEIAILDDDDDQALRIVTASAVAAGAEVHNTYGELGNTQLLEKYGFTLRENPHNSVTVETQPLLVWAAERLGPQDFVERRDFIKQHTPWLRRSRYMEITLYPNGYLPCWALAMAWVVAAEPGQEAWNSPSDVLPQALFDKTQDEPHAPVAWTDPTLIGRITESLAAAFAALVQPRLAALEGRPGADSPPAEQRGPILRLSPHDLAARAAQQLVFDEVSILRAFLKKPGAV